MKEHTGPLAPRLYHALESKFGSVSIANPGVVRTYRKTIDKKGRPTREIVERGEYYKVDCPECGDTRGRLCISYTYGEPDEYGRPDYFGARCYNENCIAKPDKRDRLSRRIFGLITEDERKRLLWKRPASPDSPIDPSAPVRLPGVVIPLDKLDDYHPAITYVRARGFDPIELATKWGVGYCSDADSRFYKCLHRIVVPVYAFGVLVGWQARLIDDSLKSRTVPKYYTLKGFFKSRYLYNRDRAANGNVVVLVEGVTDVWAVGDPAVAIFGHELDAKQSAGLDLWSARGGLLVVMIDPDARAKFDAMIPELYRKFGGRIVNVSLPEGVDAGDLTRVEAWSEIESACARSRIPLGDFIDVKLASSH